MRNIVNLLELEDLLREFYSRYESGNNLLISKDQLRAYIYGNIKNYCLRKAPVYRDFFFYWRDKNYLEREIFHKSEGPYHRVDLKDMFFRSQAVLDFICYSGYSHHKDITTLDFEIAEKKHSQWIKKLQREKHKIEGLIKEVKVFANGYRIHRLEDKTAYEKEGFMMNHCVGSYFDRSQSQVYSLRNEQGKSLVTFEEKKGIIIQYVMNSNQPISSSLKPFLNEFAQEKSWKFRYQKSRGSRNLCVGFGVSFFLFCVGFILVRINLESLSSPAIWLNVMAIGWFISGLSFMTAASSAFDLGSESSHKIVDKI